MKKTLLSVLFIILVSSNFNATNEKIESKLLLKTNCAKVFFATYDAMRAGGASVNESIRVAQAANDACNGTSAIQTVN